MEHDGCKLCKYENCSMESKECIGCKQNAVDKYTRMTNADRIRYMSIEELAELLYSFHNLEDKVKFCKNKEECTDAFDDGKDIPDSMCKKCLVEWLQSEVEE